jgi:iron-sulfur cluster assembly protein
MLEITDAAAAKVLQLQRDGRGLRILVKSGGCSGLTYVFDWSILAASDQVFEHQGARVFVDPKTLMFIRGSVLDYDDSLLVRNFVLRNPNAKSSCGCGKSFEV